MFFFIPLISGALGCSFVLPDRPVFTAGLSLGPFEGEWVVKVGGPNKIVGNLVELTDGEFLVDDISGASFPLDKIAHKVDLSVPRRPDFTGQYKVEVSLKDFVIEVDESDDEVGIYELPWAPRKEGEFTVVTPVPYAVGYWSSVSRKQVYVVEQPHEFGPSVLHVLDLDDGSWFEPTEFNGSFDAQGGLAQLKTLDKVGIVESNVPCCACSSIEWIRFDAEGMTKAITMDPINGDAGFDREGNLLKTDFDSIFIFRAPEYEEELVVKYSDAEMADALSGPLRCSEAERDCPGLTEDNCGFAQTMLKFAGASKSKATGRHGACGCERACADKGSEYWTLKKSSGRCVCYSGGKPKRVVRGLAFVSSHNFEE